MNETFNSIVPGSADKIQQALGKLQIVAEQYGLRVIFILILMYLAWTASGWVSNFVLTSLTRMKFDATLTKFLAKLTRWGALMMAMLVCMSKFGIEMTTFAAVIGAAGLAIGLAFQGTLSNFAAGAMLLIFRPYRVGDVINSAGQLGKVDEIELFTTTLDTFDNRRIIIPNNEIFGSVIENVTFHTNRRADVDVGVSYDADIDRTREVLLAAISEVEGVLADPEPAAVLTGLGGSSVDWSVRAWVRTSEYGAAKQSLLRAVKNSLESAEIEIPYPRMDISIMPNAETSAQNRAA